MEFEINVVTSPVSSMGSEAVGTLGFDTPVNGKLLLIAGVVVSIVVLVTSMSEALYSEVVCFKLEFGSWFGDTVLSISFVKSFLVDASPDSMN